MWAKRVTVVGSIPTQGNEIFNILIISIKQNAALSFTIQHATPQKFGGEIGNGSS